MTTRNSIITKGIKASGVISAYWVRVNQREKMSYSELLDYSCSLHELNELLAHTHFLARQEARREMRGSL